jgi:hypothetical protein
MSGSRGDPHCPRCLYLMIVSQRLAACEQHARAGEAPRPDLPHVEGVPLFSGEVYQRLRALRASIRAQAPRDGRAEPSRHELDGGGAGR